MTEGTNTPTMRDLMKRIDELEAKLVPAPKPDMNQILREQINQVRSRTTFTDDASKLMTDLNKKESTRG